MSSTVSPSDADLLAAIVQCQSQDGNANLGASKIHELLLAANPNWIVSDKRLRKTLRFQREQGTENGTIESPKRPPKPKREKGKTKEIPDDDGILKHPTSQLNQDLQIDAWTKKVQVKYFDDVRGKGLVATEDIKAYNHIWKEDPFVYSPLWEAQDEQMQSRRCALCVQSLSAVKYTPIACPHECSAVWCSRLCASRAKDSHPFLCTSQNPACIPLLHFVRDQTWIAASLWAKIVAILLAEWVENPATAGSGKAWHVMRSLAGMTLPERIKRLPNWWVLFSVLQALLLHLTRSEGRKAVAKSTKVLWDQAYAHYIQAFDCPSDPTLAKKLNKLKKGRKIPPELHEELFSLDGFLLGLGKMSLNTEAHGGIYKLHSHLNHDCNPNASVRHIDGSQAPGRITIVATRDIPAGDEILVCYVDPSYSVRRRQRELNSWGFGPCDCARCVEETNELGEAAGSEDKEDELEDEIRNYLGV
ncbi:SET domain-containing protein 5 [Tulasnella sp. 403]|nr:SET domain-containing protein 5 [Tulasnella sp. 403]